MSAFAFNRIMAGLKEVAAHRAGDTRGSRHHFGPGEIDVARIRNKIDLTQDEFAQLCGVSVATLSNWEQRRRRPTGPSRALLMLLQANPKSALRTLQRQAA
jgi:putative transcriptional regulator